MKIIRLDEHIMKNIRSAFEKEGNHWNVHRIPSWLRAKGFDGRYGYVGKDQKSMTAYFPDDKVATMFVLRWS